jgi:hypothetical protein
LHYFQGGVALANAIHDAAALLLRRFQLPAPDRGIMRIKTSDLPAFEAAMVCVGDTYRLDHDVAAARLGRYYVRGEHYFDVPDGPFAEAEVIQLARDDAAGQGVAMREVNEPVRLDANARGEVVVIADGETIEAAQVVVAAGCGTPRLLKDLGIAHDLAVVRTPLLVVKHDASLKVPLFVDRVAKYAVTQPEPGRLVFGTRGDLPTQDPASPTEREVTSPEGEALLDSFREATGLQLGPDEYRMHAGLEIERRSQVLPHGQKESREDAVQRRVHPIIGLDPRYPNLWWALPGRATLAMSVAIQLADRLTIGDDAKSAPPLGALWYDNIEMFYRASYD